MNKIDFSTQLMYNMYIAKGVNMHRTQIYIEDDLFAKVKNISSLLNISISEFIRTAVKNEITKDSKNNMDDFFENFEALESFKNVDAAKYIHDIRANSRIINE